MGKSSNSLSNLIKDLSERATAEVVDYIIKNKHKYIKISKQTYSILINVEDNYDSVLKNERDNFVIVTDVNGSFYYNEIDITSGEDVIGYDDYNMAICDCNDDTKILCTKANTKVIFSPMLANYLLEKGFNIIHLKENKKTGGSIFVFALEKGFGKAIEEYKESRLEE